MDSSSTADIHIYDSSKKKWEHGEFIADLYTMRRIFACVNACILYLGFAILLVSFKMLSLSWANMHQNITCKC